MLFDSSCFLLFAVKNLLQSLPTLENKISAVENLTSDSSQISNITGNIKKIKELIELARDAANRVGLRSHPPSCCGTFSSSSLFLFSRFPSR